MNISSWVRAWKRSLGLTGPVRPAQRPRLRVESLEDRTVPATHTWTAQGGNFNWSDAGNWDANGVPTSNEPGGTIVVMPVNDNTFQDIPDLTINQIRFTNPGFCTVALSQPLTVNNSSLIETIVNASGTNTISGGTLTLAGNTCYIPVTGGSLTISSQITGSFGFVLRAQSTGTLTLGGGSGDTAANTYTGDTYIDGGTLLLNKAPGTDAIPGDVSVGNESGTDTLRLLNNDQLADSSVMTFFAGATPGDSAKFELNGFNETVRRIRTTLSGRLPVIQNVESGAPAGPNTAAVLTVSSDVNSTYDGIIRDNAGGSSRLALVKAGAGTLTLANTAGTSNSYTGGTTITGGVLSVDTVADSGTSGLGFSGTLAFQGGTLQYTGAGFSETTRAVSLTGGSGAIDVPAATGILTLNGAVTGAFANPLRKTGAGTLTFGGAADNDSLNLNAQAGTVLLAKLSGASVHAVAGISDIAAGATVRLAFGGGDQIYDGPFAGFGSVNLSGGTLDLNGLSEGFNVLTGTGTVTDNSGTAGQRTLTVGTSGGGGTFTGVVSKLRLTKVGSGTLELGGTGDNANLNLDAQAGTVKLAKVTGSDVFAVSSVANVSAGATVQFAGTGGGRQVYAGITLTGGALDLNGRAESFGLGGTGTVTDTSASGDGTATVPSSVTPTGPITVSGGLLLLNGALADGPANPDLIVSGTGAVGGTGPIQGTTRVVGGDAAQGIISALLPGTETAYATLPTGSVEFQAAGLFGVKVNGTGAGQFDALSVTGTVAISPGSFLFVSVPLDAVIPTGTPIVIINNDGTTDGYGGTFTDVTTGTPVPQDGTVFSDTGMAFTVSYTGGDGNDVTLTRAVATLPVGSFQLSAATATVGEAAGSVVLTVTRVNGSAGAASVSFATADVTAVAGSDYTAASGTLNFADGETTKTITIPIANDAVVESAEAFTLTLGSPTGGATLGATVTTNVSIVDDDSNSPPAIVVTGATNLVVREGGLRTIEVRLASPPTGTVTLVAAAYGVNRNDVKVTPGQLVFTPANWNIPQTVTIKGTQDVDQSEPAETVNIRVNTKTALTADPAYSGLIQRFTASVRDRGIENFGGTYSGSFGGGFSGPLAASVNSAGAITVTSPARGTGTVTFVNSIRGRVTYTVRVSGVLITGTGIATVDVNGVATASGTWSGAGMSGTWSLTRA